MRDDEIMDCYDNMMRHYFVGEDYAYSQQIIDRLTEDLRKTLSAAQKEKLNMLLSAISQDGGLTARTSFITGVRNSEKILSQNPME